MKIKQVLGLIIGLIVGVVGGILFSKSLPPEEGSLQDDYEIALTKLQKSERRLQALMQYQERDPGGTKGRMKDLMRDIRDGKEISPDDLLATMKPWMRRMSPVFERIREANAEDWADARTSEWARKYNLNRDEREKLKLWFAQKERDRARALTEIVEIEQSGFVDFLKATDYDWRDSLGADRMMEGILEGEELEKFRADRLDERARSVQNEADRNLTKLDEIVLLDDTQHRELFDVMSRGSQDYLPDVSDSKQAPLDLESRNSAIDELLRPDQLQLLNTHRENRKTEAEKEMERFGLTLPDNWDALERTPF